MKTKTKTKTNMKMKTMFNCAIDIGASSGRVMVSRYENGILSLEEIHRFPNEPVTVNGVLYWDALRLFHEIKTGLKMIAAEKIPLAGIGIDTWGVDYALLDGNGHMIGMPVHYRDARTAGYAERTTIPLSDIYACTGIQLLTFNTLFQLMADADQRPGILQAAQDLLFVPDLFAFFLTGQKINEYTIASTSQLINAATRDWDDGLIASAAPPGVRKLLRKPTPPGTVIGPLTAEVLAETGLDASVRLVAVGSHDTASAVAGTPLSGDDCAYLSCGTWSLIGLELDTPCLTNRSYEMNFTNEGGLDGKIRYLKNINGLWMIQQLLKNYNSECTNEHSSECTKEQTNGRNERNECNENKNKNTHKSAFEKRLDFPGLIREAENALNKNFAVAPNDPSFTNPPNMAAAVRAYCVRTGQGEPQGIGETAMAAYNGLTREYASALADLEILRGKPITTLHMVGGGVRDTLLCRLTAQTTGKRVEAGPTEASALGNVAAQLMGLGVVNNLHEARAIIRRSFEPVVYASDDGR